MRIHLIASIISLLGIVGCVQPLRETDSASVTEQRTYMEQQVKFDQLRNEMGPIVRQISVALPLDCNTALMSISDLQTRETLMDIAAIAGIYAAMQVSAPDPRVGLTNLLISGESIRNALKIAAENGPYPSLLPMVATLDLIEADLFKLGDKWLTPEVLEQVRLITTRTNPKDKAPLEGLLKVNEMLVTKFKMPKSIHIDSSFVQFDDNGVLERALGEIHALRLAGQEGGAIFAQLPLAMEFRLRRALVATINDPSFQKIQAEFAQMSMQMKELQQLQALQQLQSLDALKNLELLKNLESLKALDVLKNLELLKNLEMGEQLTNLQSLQALDDLSAFRWFAFGAIAVGLVGQGFIFVWFARRCASK
ncbi:MAG: hypothetical protein O3B75_00815 [Planctomycetota bacterium]|nr:hypothetical protein [Planctomycetota bacterium]